MKVCSSSSALIDQLRADQVWLVGAPWRHAISRTAPREWTLIGAMKHDECGSSPLALYGDGGLDAVLDHVSYGLTRSLLMRALDTET